MHRRNSNLIVCLMEFLRVLIPTLLFVPIFLILILSCTSIFMYRFFLSKVAKVFRTDIAEIVSSRSVHFTKDFYELETNPRYTVVMCTQTRQGVPLEKVRSVTSSICSIKKNERCKQYIVPWMGFYFWKCDSKFSIENHVNFINDEDYEGVKNTRTSEKEVTHYDDKWFMNFKKQLLKKPYKKERSPWEIIIVEDFKNREGNKSCLLILRAHHSLTDGYGCLNLLMDMSESPIEYPKFTLPKRSLFSTFLYISTFIFRVPYEFVKINLDINDKHSMKLQEYEYSGILSLASAPLIPLDIIKVIKNQFNVSFISVLLAGVAAGIRKTLMDKRENLPRSINFMLPFPMLGRPTNKLDNYMGVLFLEVPIAEEDSRLRLLEINKALMQYKFSVAPLLTFYFIPIIGSLFPWMVKRFSLPPATALVTIFPGPTKPVDLYGYRASETSFCINMPFDSSGIALSFLSYNGQLKLEIVADEKVISSDVYAECLLKLIEEEWQDSKSVEI